MTQSALHERIVLSINERINAVSYSSTYSVQYHNYFAAQISLHGRFGVCTLEYAIVWHSLSTIHVPIAECAGEP